MLPIYISATQNDSYQVKTISSIIQSFGWREVVPIYIDNHFGEGIIPFLADALEDSNARIPYRSVIPEFATDDQIASELYKLTNMQTRVFIVHMTVSLGTKLFTKAKELGMMSERYVWIITDAMANELTSMDSLVIEAMQGVIGVKPYVPRTKQLENFTTRWKLKFQQENPTILNAELNVFGLWAYDSATALAMAAEKSRITGAPFQKLNISGNATDLETIGVSKDGPKLLQAILNTTFKGLSGDFQLVDGQLQSPAYQKNKEYVGFQQGSFVKELLIKNNFDEDRLKQYNTSEECIDLLSKGSAKGGIAAAFDEIPYLKHLQATPYCSKYTKVGPMYKSDGFGFAFPIGSPLLHDVSKAVLSVTEGEKLVHIEKEWFGQPICSDSSTSLHSNSLGLDSFWGLFAIAGTAAIFALLIFVTKFMRDHWHIIRRSDPSFRGRIRSLARNFDTKDFSCHTFRNEIELRNGMRVSGHMDGPQSPHDNSSTLPSPQPNGPPTPQPNGRPSPSISSHTEATPPLHEENVASSTHEIAIESAVELRAGH